MTPGGRLQAVIEALDAVRIEGRPADRILHEYFRARRYIGGKDRRVVTELFWRVMRNRARLASDCALAEARNVTDAAVRAESGRRLAIALCVADKVDNEADLALFTGEAYAPQPLDKREEGWVAQMRRLKASDRPEWAWAETPEWLWERFAAVWGDDAETEIKVARAEAQVDLRVNTLRADREAARARLKIEGVETEPTPYSPIGLRCVARVNVAATGAFAEGWVEVQDESAQLAALLVGAKPGETVVDFCAGAGGKALALAAEMHNKGRLTACDVSQARLDRGAERFKRAGAFNVTRRALSGETDKWVKRHKGTADRVLVDAPCSGSGTWRRNPDARWRTTPEDIAELVEKQARILASASRLVRPGGRLIYATCSMFEEENGAQIAAFLAAKPEFSLVPVAEAWAQAPAELAGQEMLRLTPGRHGTDGFFVAVMQRAADAAEQGETP